MADYPGFPRHPLNGLSRPQLPPHPHAELPRLQVPPLPIVQPHFQQHGHLHWKAQAPVMEPPQHPALSRMRMVANFFTSESSRQNAAPPAPTPVPSTPTTMLPSLHEILGRTKQLYINTSQAVHIATPEMPEAPSAGPSPITPTFPQQASFSLRAPTPINIRATMNTAMYRGDTTPLPSPSESLASPSSQSGKSSKRRERWTEDEHARFMEGLNRYGRKWKKIQAFVKTKTAVQVRTHAYGYFAKLLRNMPEDDAAWELAEEMSSLPGAVLKGPSSGKRRSEPKTDEAGMEVLRRFVFARKKADSMGKGDDADMETASVSSIQSLLTDDRSESASTRNWGPQEQWNSDESSAGTEMSDLKRQRLH